jgi:hypothetical protein
MKLDKFGTTPYSTDVRWVETAALFSLFSLSALAVAAPRYTTARITSKLFFTFKSDSLRRVSASRICA